MVKALPFSEQIRLKAFIKEKGWPEEAARSLGIAVLWVRQAADGEPVPAEEAARLVERLDAREAAFLEKRPAPGSGEA